MGWWESEPWRLPQTLVLRAVAGPQDCVKPFSADRHAYDVGMTQERIEAHKGMTAFSHAEVYQTFDKNTLDAVAVSANSSMLWSFFLQTPMRKSP